jgi:ribosomal protein S7
MTGIAPSLQPVATPALDPAGQRHMDLILKTIQDAARPKPAEVAALVNQQLTAALPAVGHRLRDDFQALAGQEIDKMRSAAEAVVDAIRAMEAKLPEEVTELVAAAIEKLAPRPVVVTDPAGNPLGTPVESTRPEFVRILRRVRMGVNVLLVGPAGAGKTHLAKQLADALGLEFAFSSCSAGMTESKFLGRFVPIGANGSFVFVHAAFLKLFEHGGLYLLDEVDAADPNVLMVLNAALANGYVETNDPARPMILKHKDFRCLAAANTWGHGADRMYVGRNQLDAATLDRFCAGKFALDYDEVFEQRAGHPVVVAWVHALRRQIRELKLRRVASTRLVLDGSAVVRNLIAEPVGMSVADALADLKASYFTDWTAEDRAKLRGAAE